MSLFKAIIITACSLALCSAIAFAPEPATSPMPSRFVNHIGTMIDLLPESTVLAVEIKGVARRWPEIRSVPAISRVLDRLLTGSGLDPEDLPRLAGNTAVLALVSSANGRTLTALALLRPPDLVEAEENLGGVAVGEAPLALHRGRGALWVGFPNASERLEPIAGGDGTSARASLMMGEVDLRLPAGGLIRGWVNPRVLRAFVGRDVEGSRSAPIEIIRSFATATLDTLRFIGFRRELDADGITTDAVIRVDTDALPHEVARALNSRTESSLLLPSPLPPGTLLTSSFRTEAEACVAWLRFVAASDLRGPLRNLDFWMEEFRARSGLDPGRDLFGALDEQGWFLLLEGDTSKPVRAVVILETRDPGRVEETLLELRGWLSEHVQGRSLGSVLPRIRDETLNGRTLHGLTLWTPFAELAGPAFLVTDEHLVIGTGKPALRAGLMLLETKDTWMRARGTTSRSLREHIRVQGPAIARWLEAFVAPDASDPGPLLVSAVIGLLAETDDVSADVWTEEDAFRLRGRVRFIVE